MAAPRMLRISCERGHMTVPRLLTGARRGTTACLSIDLGTASPTVASSIDFPVCANIVGSIWGRPAKCGAVTKPREIVCDPWVRPENRASAGATTTVAPGRLVWSAVPDWDGSAFTAASVALESDRTAVVSMNEDVRRELIELRRRIAELRMYSAARRRWTPSIRCHVM